MRRGGPRRDLEHRARRQTQRRKSGFLALRRSPTTPCERQGIRTNPKSGLTLKCYFSPEGKRFWHKKDIEKHLGRQLPKVEIKEKAEEAAPKAYSPGRMRFVTDPDAIPSWPDDSDWLPKDHGCRESETSGAQRPMRVIVISFGKMGVLGEKPELRQEGAARKFVAKSAPKARLRTKIGAMRSMSDPGQEHEAARGGGRTT